MKRIFLKDRAGLLAGNKADDRQLFTDALVSGLPGPLRRYLRVCGYMNRPVPCNADISWSESAIKLSPDKDWGRLKTVQFNSVDPIGRVAYMKFIKMPVAGRDLYRNGYGEMKGKLLGLFRVIFDNSSATAQSVLITTFCEFLLIPGYLLSKNVMWEEVNTKTVRGTLAEHGMKVEALFLFNDEGLLTRVETGDRYYSEGKGAHKKVRFSALIESYRTQGEILIPEKMTAVWHFTDGDYEYFRGVIDRVEYNVHN